MKKIKINVPEGYEIDKDKSTFENIVFKEKNRVRILFSTRDNGEIYWKGKLIDVDIDAVYWIRNQLYKPK